VRARTQRQPIEANQWVKGLITEASPLNFPEGSSVDEENFVLDRNGSRARRLGIDYEAGYSLVNLAITATGTTHAIQNYLWENVGQNPLSNYFVHQFGNKLYVFDADTTAVSSNLLFGGAISLTATVRERFSFASIQGNLVIAVGDQTLRVIKPISSTYTLTFTRLKVRDFWGVDDGFATDERTSTLTNLHAYNLYNQGWPPEFFCSSDPDNPTTMDNGTVEDPVERTKLSIGVYPSNADILFSALTMLTNGRKAYYPHALKNVVSGNTPAANGHYIIDLFDRSQGRKDTYDADIAAGWSARRNYKTSIPTDQSTGGIKAVAAYAGRIFFACSPGETGGDAYSPKVGTFVLFSQLVDNLADLEKCYQEADPTAEDISDLIDTDGGYLQLPDAINIKALIPFKSSLLVFADNGVWAIAGGDRGFTATEYQSQFLTNNGVISAESIVVTTDAVLYWSRNGIFALGMGQAGIEIQSLTEFTIQSLYNNIPFSSKKYATGYFDDVSQRCRWLYRAVEVPSLYRHRYTHELILDMSMPAWSKFTFKDTQTRTPLVTGYVPVPVQSRSLANADFKYSTMRSNVSNTYLMTVSYFKNTGFKEWDATSSGTDVAAYLVTGYITGGDSARKKYAPYLTVHCNRTEKYWSDEGSGTFTLSIPSSCLIQAQWEWCTSVDSGRWGQEFQAYRFRQPFFPESTGTFSTGYSVITTRNKIRGNGRALSFKFSTEEGKDLQLLGWNIEMGANKEP